MKRSRQDHLTVVLGDIPERGSSRHLLRVAVAAALACWALPTYAQTEAECLSSFAVKPGLSVSYIAASSDGRFKPPVTMSCIDAEKFRERLFISIDRNTYDSEIILKNKLRESNKALDGLSKELNSGLDKIALRTKLAGAAAIVYTPAAIASTAACASAVVDGIGLAACGPAVKSSLAATTAWVSLQSFAGEAAALKTAAQGEIGRIQTLISETEQKLDATKAKSMKDNYSTLFVAICRAIKQQCLL